MGPAAIFFKNEWSGGYAQPLTRGGGGGGYGPPPPLSAPGDQNLTLAGQIEY